MERPIFKPVGTPVDQLDTPSLVVDLDALERNIETMHGFFRGASARLRPDVEPHRCPAIAHMQLAAGGTVGGISVTTLGQAEVFRASGITDISLANVAVTPAKIKRLCALASRADMTAAVDDERNVRQLSAAASASGVRLNLVVAINTDSGGIGVETGQQAVALARAVTDADALELAGIATYQGPNLGDETEAEIRQSSQRVLDSRDAIEAAGIEVNVVSVGGTRSYQVAAATDGVTEISAGSYALMDQKHRAHRPEFQPAAMVMTTVTSAPEDGLVITDGGHKSIGGDFGLPFVENVAGALPRGLSAEHVTLMLGSESADRPGLGDKVWLTPWDIGTCVNLHDYIQGVRDGKLEVVWEMAARGQYR